MVRDASLRDAPHHEGRRCCASVMSQRLTRRPRARGQWPAMCGKDIAEEAMLSVENPAELSRHVGQKLGTSDWLAVDQAMINAFAEVTGDNHWIHVDIERCKREMPG